MYIFVVIITILLGYAYAEKIRVARYIIIILSDRTYT